MFSKKKYPKLFTPPTCTLEIGGKLDSAKVSNFVLNFDDPKLAQEQQVSIKGEQSQLIELSQTVNKYIKTYLEDPLKKSSFEQDGKVLAITRQENLRHELSFRNLESSSPSVTLSTSQLFDLVDALEQWEIECFPTKSTFNKQTGGVLGKMALSLLLVGLGILAYHWLSNTKTGKKVAITTSTKLKNLSKNEFPVIMPGTLSRPNPIPSNLVIPANLGKMATMTPPPQVVIPSPDPVQLTENQPNQSQTVKPLSIAIYPLSSANQAPALPPPLKIEAPPPLTSERIAKLDDHPLSSTSLLDTIVQVKEVREYFQKTWKVPHGLEQTLEYRLEVNPQGRITEIIPLGRNASFYLNQTSMPTLNQPFVSPLFSKESATIRLVLLPDGTVQTFLE